MQTGSPPAGAPGSPPQAPTTTSPAPASTDVPLWDIPRGTAPSVPAVPAHIVASGLSPWLHGPARPSPARLRDVGCALRHGCSPTHPPKDVRLVSTCGYPVAPEVCWHLDAHTPSACTRLHPCGRVWMRVQMRTPGQGLEGSQGYRDETEVRPLPSPREARTCPQPQLPGQSTPRPSGRAVWPVGRGVSTLQKLCRPPGSCHLEHPRTLPPRDRLGPACSPH